MRTALVSIALTLSLLKPALAENSWEVSFGTTQLFSSWYSKESSPVPTASATLILSRKVVGDFALWGVFNLPLAPNKVVTSNGVSELTMTPPTFMLGASYEVLSVSMGENKKIGVDLGGSVGRSLTLDGQFFPVGATRLKLMKGEDMTIYLGLTTAPYNPQGDLIWGLIYGAGTRF